MHAILLLLLSPAARAAGLPAFQFTGLEGIRSRSAAAVPAPGEGRALPGPDVVTDPRFLLQAGTDALFGWADGPAQAAEPAAYWTAALTAAGVTVGPMSFKDGMYTLPYATADGRAIRQFLADPRQFAPKDPAALRADMAATVAALEKDGLTPLASRVVDVDFMLPTYEVLYLTKPADKPELETRLRVLKAGDDIDPSVYARAGVDVLAAPAPFMMVYIGPEAGYVSMGAATRQAADEKLAEREKFLAGQGLRVVSTRVTPYDDAQVPEIKFIIEVYWVAGPRP